MKKIIFAFFLSFGISFAQNGNILVPQASSNSSFDNWTFGGNIGATFGNYSLGVFITPRIGYKLTNDLELSANVNYTLQNTEYYQNNLIGFGPEIITSIEHFIPTLLSITISFLRKRNLQSKQLIFKKMRCTLVQVICST